MFVWHPETGLEALTTALAAALDGSGPAVLPLPSTTPAVLQAILDEVRPGEPLEHDDVAVVMTTSGSTGTPKGVLLTADNLRSSAVATAGHLGGEGSWLLALDPGHVAGLQVVVRSLLAATEPTAYRPADGFTSKGFCAAVAGMPSGWRCTSLVPTQLVRLLPDEEAVAALRTFDAVLLGGAATAPALLDAATAAGIRVTTTYGMSETSGGCVYDGTPLPGASFSLEDGRISLHGPMVAAGYRRRPELTAEHFAGGAYLTNDAGEVGPDGRLRVLGRIDDIVVSGGENVALPAVEAAALRSLKVLEAAAFGRPDEEWGTRVELAVVPRDPADPPDLAELRATVAAEAGRAAAPRRLHLLDRLPLLAAGKVDRIALRGLPER
ncbi:O-succinylbenzoic acid--CoA ligase [Motilibacter rhizosphaerae]|uniref:O-succinylbenzoic acid--CoA ligase n=1 Tax=Motilibacter rhizosphaerae TaxID=598652 RepID=A0A4Q7NAE0_9ACTN|nr:o-succinylbenzoate--CoA ligase [Motilibacter rhizosphaerae]RZS79037.1 O-succinylbenzoic acid--CoA ligase [Motilibacter rhizosphaerae]